MDRKVRHVGNTLEIITLKKSGGDLKYSLNPHFKFNNQIMIMKKYKKYEKK